MYRIIRHASAGLASNSLVQRGTSLSRPSAGFDVPSLVLRHRWRYPVARALPTRVPTKAARHAFLCTEVLFLSLGYTVLNRLVLVKLVFGASWKARARCPVASKELIMLADVARGATEQH